MVREKHTVNGVLNGYFYHHPDGRVVYLAHRTRRQIYRKDNAWCMDVDMLSSAKRKGVTSVGVVMNDAKNGNMFWLTNLEDFFGEHSIVIPDGKTRQRGLPLQRFRIDPMTSAEYIASTVKIR